MRKEKRILKIKKYEKRRDEVLQTKPYSTFEVAGNLYVNTRGIKNYLDNLDAETTQLVHHTFLYYLENNEFIIISKYIYNDQKNTLEKYSK